MFLLHWAPQIMWPLLADSLEVEHEREESRVALSFGLSTRKVAVLYHRTEEERGAGGWGRGRRCEVGVGLNA